MVCFFSRAGLQFAPSHACPGVSRERGTLPNRLGIRDRSEVSRDRVKTKIQRWKLLSTLKSMIYPGPWTFGTGPECPASWVGYPGLWTLKKKRG